MDYKNKYLKYKLKYLAAKKQYTGGDIIDNNQDIIHNNQDNFNNNQGIIDNNEGIIDNNKDTIDINKDTIDKDFFEHLFKKIYRGKTINDLKVQITEEQNEEKQKVIEVEEEEWFFFNEPYPTIIFTEVDACSTSIIYGKNKEGDEVMVAIHIRPDNNLKKLLEQLLHNFKEITKIYILTNSNNNNIYDLLNKLAFKLETDLNGKIFILNIKTEFITSGMHFSHIGNTIKIIYTDKQIHIEGWTGDKVPTIEHFEKDDDTNFSPYIIYPDNNFEYRVFYYVLKTCKKLHHILESFENNFCSILSEHKTNQYITYSPELCDKILELYDNDSKALADMSPEDRARALAAMSPEERAEALAAMSPEERAEALAAMSPEDRAAALAAMSPEDREASLDSINDEETCEDSIPDHVKYWLAEFLIQHPNIMK